MFTKSHSQDLASGGGEINGVTDDYKSVRSINQYIRVKQCCSPVIMWDPKYILVLDSAAP